MATVFMELGDSPLTEPAPAPEIFCNNIGAIELIGGGCARFYLYSNETPIDAGPDATPVRVVVCKIVAPVASIPSAARLMLDAAKAAGCRLIASFLQ